MLSYLPSARTRTVLYRVVTVLFGGLLGVGLPQMQAQAQTRIMPIGNSITHGTTQYNSYRRSLWHKLQAGGYHVNFVGSQNSNQGGPPPNPDFDPDHEGHAGWRAEQLMVAVEQWTRDAQPDIVLLHAGTNDVLQRHTPQSTRDELSQLIDNMRAAKPNVKILLAQLIPLVTAPPTPNNDINVLNDLLPALAQQKSTLQSPIYLVDQHTGFDASADLYDYIHPSASGEEKMAVRWYAALQAVLGSPGVQAPPVADAGPDQHLTLATGIPTTSTQLSGRGTATGGTISGYSWTQTSGPTSAQFSAANVATPMVAALQAGSYRFRLVVTTTLGVRSEPDEVVVTVTSATQDPTFYRAINVNGAALTLDGQTWEGSSAPNYSVVGTALTTPAVPLVPATDAPRAAMLRSFVYNSSGPVRVTLRAVPAGSYEVYVHVFEDNAAEVYSLSLNQQVVLRTYSGGPAGSWARLGPYAVNVTDNVLELAGSGGTVNVAGLEVWTAGTSAPLPVELVQFRAQPVPAGTQLHWTTASEQHHAYFTVERRDQGSAFTALRDVPGQGTSTQSYTYTFLDNTVPTAPVLYYRLRHTDTDGTTTYSPVVTVVPLTATKLELSPVPTQDVLIVNGAMPHTRLLLWNAAGQLLREIPASTPRVVVDLADLPSGLYYVQAQAQRVRFIKY